MQNEKKVLSEITDIISSIQLRALANYLDRDDLKRGNSSDEVQVTLRKLADKLEQIDRLSALLFQKRVN